MDPRIAVVNYGMGNLRSVEKAVERVGATPEISSDPARIDAADGLILPGVGAFPRAMARIEELGLAETIVGAARSGKPVLGVCLGMQLLFTDSVEGGGARGLGLLPGSVTRIDAPGLKLPHIGWSPLALRQSSPLTDGIDEGEPFYFVHSFVARPRGEDLLADAGYGERIAAVIGSGNVFGAQFHPEKSSAAGLRMLANFCSLCAPVGA